MSAAWLGGLPISAYGGVMWAEMAVLGSLSPSCREIPVLALMSRCRVRGRTGEQRLCLQVWRQNQCEQDQQAYEERVFHSTAQRGPV